jgi:hypothetical protein
MEGINSEFCVVIVFSPTTKSLYEKTKKMRIELTILKEKKNQLLVTAKIDVNIGGGVASPLP